MRSDEASGGLNRRQLMTRGAGAAAAAAAAGAMAPATQAAVRSKPRAGARPMTDAQFNRGYLTGLASLKEEISIARLPVEGTIPRWLSGTLVRNGPAQWEIGKRTFNHWFDGLAMLHAFAFRRGRVSYANRFLRSSQYESAREHDKISYTEFGTEPCRDIFKGAVARYELGPVPNANVTVTRLGDEFVAATEYPLPVVFDPRTLETLGVHEPSESDAHLTTAHFHRDPRTGEVFEYQIRLYPGTAYTVRSFSHGQWRKLAEVRVQKPAYLHSFALTPRYVVIVEGPLLVDPTEFLMVKRPFLENYKWEPDRGTRFIVIDRSTGAHVSTLAADAFFCFHNINAWEESGRIVADLVAHRDSSIMDALYIAKLRGETQRKHGWDFDVRRCTLDLTAKTAKVEPIGAGLELPRIDYDRLNTSPYRYVYGVSIADPESGGFFNQIDKLDTASGRRTTWREPGCYPSEPIFVRAPGARREDGGVLLSVVLDGRSRTSFLLVLDARTLDEIGRAFVPHHVPFGFHGEHFSV